MVGSGVLKPCGRRFKSAGYIALSDGFEMSIPLPELVVFFRIVLSVRKIIN